MDSTYDHVGAKFLQGQFPVLAEGQNLVPQTYRFAHQHQATGWKDASDRAVSPRDELPSLHDDFNRINELLAGLVGEVQESLAWIWPPLRWFNRRLGNVENAIINFSMSKARDEAWSVAERLAPLIVEQQVPVIEKLDGEVAEFANVIRHPGFFPATLGKIIRLGERGSVHRIIETLE
jgi:hypothetical protein